MKVLVCPSARAGLGMKNIENESAATAKAFPTASFISPFDASNSVDVERTLEKDGDEGAKAEEPTAKVANSAVVRLIFTIVMLFVAYGCDWAMI